MSIKINAVMGNTTKFDQYYLHYYLNDDYCNLIRIGESIKVYNPERFSTSKQLVFENRDRNRIEQDIYEYKSHRIVVLIIKNTF